MHVPTLKCSGGCIGVTAFLFFAVGLTLQFVIEGVVKKKAQGMLPLKANDSALFQPWADHGGYGSPIYNHMFVWNITNPEEYLAGEKANIEKIGPFVYRMFDWRENITWSDDPKKENISFTYHNYNVFIPERTDPDLDVEDRVYTPNYAIQGVLTTVYSALMEYPEVRDAAFDAIRVELDAVGEGILMHRSIDQVMWGYNDPTLTIIADVAKKFGITLPANLQGFIGLQAIDTPAFYAEPSVQYSGTTDYHLTAQYRTWCGNNDLAQFWPLAPEILGSDGWQFSPDPDETISLFIDALPAVVNITKKGKGKIQGIHCHTYGLGADTWSNTSWFGITHYLHAPDGVINVTASQTANVMISKPHFLDADPYYINGVTGMEPADIERDDTTIWIEPITGSAVAANQRIQINIQMSPWLCQVSSPISGPFPGDCMISEAVIPIMIFNQIISVPPNEADTLKSQIYGIPNTVKLVAWILFGASFALIGWVVIIVKAIRHKPGDDEEEEEERNDIVSSHGEYQAVQ